ncbi:MAG: hypothetical protein JRI72_05850 [Deltaproteobacteria bacterium]|nr:hypothetical protein [Deltaproteobacteria bacterium]
MDTYTFPRGLDNFRAHINSFNIWKASTGEQLTLQELIVTRNTFPSQYGIHLHPISELEKYRDHSRARWNINTSKSKDACATIDAYGIGDNKTKVKFIDGHVAHNYPHERKAIGQAFDEFIKMIISGTEERIMFEQILLEQEQKDLLAVLVEAARNVSPDKRKKFHVLRTDVKDYLRHPGLADSDMIVYFGDIEALAHENLLVLSYGQTGTPFFDITPKGFKYYEQMKQLAGQPVQRIETTIKNYLVADHFQQKYPKAYQKWADAERMLWVSDTEHQLTTIGHLCREAMQEFVTVLVEQCQPLEVEDDKALTVKRLKAVLELKTKQLGKTEKPFLDALLVYWGTVSNFVQRQEHGAQKEGQSLVWEDGRRVVFQTAIVMFEFDRSLSQAQ